VLTRTVSPFGGYHKNFKKIKTIKRKLPNITFYEIDHDFLGASGKLQAFGFCEFKEPDSALRALRLLQGYQLANKSLLIKVDDNAQTIIEQWKKRVGVMQDSDGMDVLSPQVKLNILLHFAIFSQIFEKIRLKTLLNPRKFPPDCYTFLTFFVTVRESPLAKTFWIL